MSAVFSHQTYIRTMSDRHMDTILAIEQAAYDFPWSANIFEECMKAGYVCRACFDDIEVVGYGVMSVGVGECHLMNLCIHPDRHGNGYGSMLVGDLLAIAKRANARIAFLEVRTSNRRAHSLYRHLGFNEVGIRKNYYPARRGREDAYVLAKTMD
ncbi:MAG: Ribosomal-protein-alanine acetyltransferase [Gammaproteobacteria bacterium]|nr:Ribosomal-protein-alanine acetyltransferase [Gammaproteobacteria bacterium]